MKLLKKIKPEIALFIITLFCCLAILTAIHAKQSDYFYVTQRETQTAITSDYMIREKLGLFNYITPVLGYPWAVPFEFPLYQYIVAKVAGDRLPLNNTGRFIGLLFFLATLWPAFKILRRLNIPSGQSFLFLALAVSSPIYLAYSFSFTIESTALFLAVLYLYFFIVYLQDQRWTAAAGAIAVGILAALVKVTTWVVTAGVICLIIAWFGIKQLKKKDYRWKHLLLQGLIVLLPLLAALWWTDYADAVKMKNPFGVFAVSSALSSWTYGTLAQKFSPFQWFYYMARSLVGLFGLLGLLLPLYVLFRFFKDRWFAAAPVNVKILLLSVMAFFSGPAIFTNIFFEHDYYVIPGGLFLIFAFFLLLQAPRRPLSQPGKTSSVRPFKPILILLLILSNLGTAYAYLYLKQVNYTNPLNRHIVKVIKNLPQDQNILVFGADYDSFIPYYSGKKALQTRVTDFNDTTFQAALANMKNRDVAAIVVKNPDYKTIAALSAGALGLEQQFEVGSGVSLYYNPRWESNLFLKPIDTNALADEKIAHFLRQFNGEGNRIIINLNRKTGISIIYVAYRNLYMLDFKKGFQVLDHKRYGLRTKQVELNVEDKTKEATENNEE